MQALHIHAGPRAFARIRRQGLAPGLVRAIPAAAGGPKGLILGKLDEYLFGEWLPRSDQPVDLVGASIGAWRMATACMADPVQGYQRLSHDYIHQHYDVEPGRRMPPPHRVSAEFGRSLHLFYDGHVHDVLNHPRYRLHIVTTRGRHLLAREQRLRTPLGYLGASLSNAVSRRAMGVWLERVVFSSAGGAAGQGLPFLTSDYRTRALRLDADNFFPALQASCSIPFVLEAVHDIPGGPPGAYWDGGITDYHLHLNYAGAIDRDRRPGIVLYPHFQQAVVPGWLDKPWRWRHRASHFLDDMVVLAPNPEWVRTLPNGKLPDRKDFIHYGADLAGRVRAWQRAAEESARLAEEFDAWLRTPDPARVRPL